MPVTLEEAKKLMQDHLSVGVIDEFRKSNFILDRIPFDDAVSPTGKGKTLTYGYNRLITEATADFRPVNSEYTPQEVKTERYYADLKIFGGSFEIDRVFSDTGGIADEVDLQLKQKVKAAQALFNDTVINGDSGVDANAFDGLEKALTGSDTEYTPQSTIDLSSSSAIDSNYKSFLDNLDEFLATLNGKPDALLTNSKLWAKIRACARRAGMYQQTTDSFGRNVDNYDGIPIVDMKTKAGSNAPVIPINSGVTSLFAVRFGLDAFHGISKTGQAPIKVWLPKFDTAGAVKKGEVEMVAAVALKATKAAGVMRGLKV